MQKTFFILSILSVAIWIAGMLFFSPEFLFHLLLLVAVLFYLLKIIWVELAKTNPYLELRKRQKKKQD